MGEEERKRSGPRRTSDDDEIAASNPPENNGGRGMGELAWRKHDTIHPMTTLKMTETLKDLETTITRKRNYFWFHSGFLKLILPPRFVALILIVLEEAP